MSAKLDRKRPFGQVYGQASHCYEQDGKLFDNEGDEVVGDDVKGNPADSQLTGNGTGDDAKLVAILERSNAAVLEALPGLSVDELNRASELETEGKHRVGALKAIAEELASRNPADSQLSSQLQG